MLNTSPLRVDIDLASHNVTLLLARRHPHRLNPISNSVFANNNTSMSAVARGNLVLHGLSQLASTRLVLWVLVCLVLFLSFVNDCIATLAELGPLIGSMVVEVRVDLLRRLLHTFRLSWLLALPYVLNVSIHYATVAQRTIICSSLLLIHGLHVLRR